MLRSARGKSGTFGHTRWACDGGLTAGKDTYARTDEPVDEAAPRTCPLCGEVESRIIYSEDDGAQFYRRYTYERHCSACGQYFPEEFRAPG